MTKPNMSLGDTNPGEDIPPAHTERVNRQDIGAGHMLLSSVADLSSVVHNPEPLSAFSQALQDRYGTSETCATAINIAALSAVIGPTRTIKNPLGGVLSATVNLMVQCHPGATVRRAANFSLSLFQRKIAEKVQAHQEKGTQHRRQVRMELEQECERVLHNLRNPKTRLNEPGTIPVPADERLKEGLLAAAENAEKVGRQMREFEMEERPWLLSDGISFREIKEWRKCSFDRAILNFSPDGNAPHLLETKKSDEKRAILRFLKSAWSAEGFIWRDETLVDPAVTNLWLLRSDQVPRAFQEMQASGLPETFLLVV